METNTLTDRTDKVLAFLQGCLAQDKALRIYALLDTARNERIRLAIIKSGCEHISLYPADVPEPLAAAAPYLVELPTAHTFLRWLIENGWGDSWGIYVISSASLQNLRKHFRNFLKAQTEDGEKYLFRFYDPRVLKVYLPSCNATELTMFTAPVTAFFLEDEDNRTLLRYHSDNGELRTESVLLDRTHGR